MATVKAWSEDTGFAMRLWRAREECGMTLMEASDASGVSVPTIWNLEHSRRAPHLELVAYLAAAYSVSLDWLVWGKGDMRRG